MKTQKTALRICTVCILAAMLFTTAFTANAQSIGSNTELRGKALLNSFGITTHFYQAGTDIVTDAYIDTDGRLAVKAGGTTGNIYVGANLDKLAGTLTSYTVEAKLCGIDVADGWHYGIGWNNSRDGQMKNSFTMRSGLYTEGKTYGQLLLNPVTAANNDSTNYVGKPDTALAEMSAAIGQENVFTAVVVQNSATNYSVTFKLNGVEVATKTETSNYTLLDFNVIIPYSKTVAIGYMKVLDGSGTTVYYEDFSSVPALRSAFAEYGLVSNTFNAVKSRAGVESVYVNYNDELVIQASGTVGNSFVTLPLPESVKGLTDYSLEARIKGIAVSNNWHYGISWNTANNARGYFTMRSGPYGTSNQGMLLCYPKANGSGSYFVSQNGQGGDVITGDSSVGNYNTFKITVNSATDIVTFLFNGVKVCEIASADDALSNFSILIPFGQTIAVDEVKVYNGANEVVYSEDFVSDFDYIGSSIRYDEPSGIRVKSFIDAELTSATVSQDGYKVIEYGTLVAKANQYNDKAMTIGAAGVMKAVAYSENDGIDKYCERNTEGTVYTVALYNISNAQQDYAFRAYYTVEYNNGTTETFYQAYEDLYNLVKSLAEVAGQIKASEEYNTLTTEQKAYIDSLLP